MRFNFNFKKIIKLFIKIILSITLNHNYEYVINNGYQIKY